MVSSPDDSSLRFFTVFAINISTTARIKNKVAIREITIHTAQTMATTSETLAPIDGQRSDIKDAGISANDEYSIVMIAPLLKS
jgi:hypothetical protein